MATASTQFQSQSLPSSSMQTFVFPSKAASVPAKRPSSSSALLSKPTSSAMPSPTHSDNGVSPVNSPSTFVFPMKQSATFPKSTGSTLSPGNSQLRTPPLSPSPPNATLGERRIHTRRQSDLNTGRPLSLGALNQPFKFGSSGLTTPSPSKSVASSPGKESLSPRFSSTNGLLSPPPESSPSATQVPVEKGIPAPAPPGMSGRRGHAHRRSSAMSMNSSDVLNMILTAAKANNPGNPTTKGNSVPTSPTLSPDSPAKEPVFVIENVTDPETDTKMTLEVPSCAISCDSKSSSVTNLAAESTGSARPSIEIEDTPRKSRVTFSEATEIIPRPASAGTISTFTTIRSGMGENGSLHGYRASIGSLEELHQIDSRNRRASASDASMFFGARTKADRRPSSADAATLLNGAHKSNWFFAPMSPKDASGKKKGHARHLSESSATEKPKRKSRKAANPDGVPAPKKVKGGMKGWAGSILLRRQSKKRQLKHLPRRSPTPPLMQRDEIQRLMMEGSYVLMPAGATDYQPRESSSMEENEFEPTIDLGAYETDMEAFEFPVIDLDAALGPFNTPKSPNRQPSGFESARKRMHSAAGWNNVYHRRAESMPEMQLFSLAEDEIEGDGMGDVFEDTEEEDDEDHDITIREDDFPKPITIPAGLALNWDTDDSEVEELDIVDGLANVRKGIKRKMSRLSEDTDPASESPRSDDGMKLDESPSPIEVLTIPTPPSEAQQPSPALSTYLSKPMSDVSGNVSYGSLHHASSFDQTPAVTPSTTNTSICPPTMPSTPHTSDFLLPPVPHMYIQEDDRVTIMSGASIYEDPTLLGEPGPEIRMSVSVDDIPGTSHSQNRFYPYFHASSSTASVANSEKPTKDKKDKRWSKMFQFWKGRSTTS